MTRIISVYIIFTFLLVSFTVGRKLMNSLDQISLRLLNGLTFLTRLKLFKRLMLLFLFLSVKLKVIGKDILAVVFIGVSLTLFGVYRVYKVILTSPTPLESISAMYI
jgi:hypothetical protein